MSILGQFDTDTGALTKRLEAHARFAARDLNAWCFDLLDLAPGMQILELGCGTGKQSLPLAGRVGETGRVTAVDIAKESLETLRLDAVKAGVASRICICQSDLDEISSTVPPGPFDRVVACYSIYYAKRPDRVFKFLYEALRPGGVFFFCGPSNRNNAELKEFHDSLYALTGRSVPEKKGAAPFMEVTGQDLTREVFGNAEVFHFENPLRFDSAESLHSYWSSYNLYDETLDGAFRSRAAEHVTRAGVFESVKRVIGVRAVKSR
jgi:SAM-dependent methyltransferase